MHKSNRLTNCQSPNLRYLPYQYNLPPFNHNEVVLKYNNNLPIICLEDNKKDTKSTSSLWHRLIPSRFLPSVGDGKTGKELQLFVCLTPQRNHLTKTKPPLQLYAIAKYENTTKHQHTMCKLTPQISLTLRPLGRVPRCIVGNHRRIALYCFVILSGVASGGWISWQEKHDGFQSLFSVSYILVMSPATVGTTTLYAETGERGIVALTMRADWGIHRQNDCLI